ncbi:MAG: NAD(P)H-dependent oxidoreductase [Chloroflexia bacterium]|nr:NAD(P)H-dependent oxidoreductase [Chloroflexia bacterium]MDQ3413336.1 NAD(P)H-dependent oxidoreductase [Chloroflexota bacterium]
MLSQVRILGLSGSLRRGSLNTALLRAASELLPADATLDIQPLHALPFYDGDVEDQGMPAVVLALKAKIDAADALLLAVPEYNYSIAPVLKNALDWATRPYGQSALDGKPVALIGASIGHHGTVRAQLHLRDVALGTNMHILNGAEILVTNAEAKFDGDLRLTDDRTREMIRQMLRQLVLWTRRIERTQHEVELIA